MSQSTLNVAGLTPFTHALRSFRSGLFVAGVIATLFISACVSIKPSTVELSAQVGQRISEMEKLHQLALQRYFETEKQKIDDFLTNTWEPVFLKNSLGASNILSLLQNVSTLDATSKRLLKDGIAKYLIDTSEAAEAADELIKVLNASRKGEEGAVRKVLQPYIGEKSLEAAVIHVSALLGTDEPARIIFEFAEGAHRAMQKQRNELMAPLDEAQAEAVARLSEAYAELIRGQSTITGRLEAAAKVSKHQDELLGKLGVNKVPVDIVDQLTNISDKINNGLQHAGDALNKIDGNNTNNAISSLKKALNSIKTDKK